MRTRVRPVLTGILTLLLGLGTVATATAAGASTSQPLRPERVSISASTFNPRGTVNATGPVAGFHGTISDLSPTLSSLNFRGGRVFVAHPRAPLPRINFRTCTATITQHAPWRFAGGTGRYHGAFGSGSYDLREFFRYRFVNGHCTAGPFARPLFYRLNIFARGFARLRG